MHSRNKDFQNAARILLDIRCHELYFSSFGKQYPSSETARRSFSSEAALLYELKKQCEDTGEKYVFVCSDSERVEYVSGSEVKLLNLRGNILVIDLSEHAYFIDYGFDKPSYVKNLLGHLDLSLLDKKEVPKGTSFFTVP
jgi:superoxide dismutase